MYEQPTKIESRAAGQIKFDLGQDAKRAWMQWCADRCLVPTRTLKAVVEQVLSGQLEPLQKLVVRPLAVKAIDAPDHGPKVRCELKFTPTEAAAIEAATRADGFAIQEWVIAAVRAALSKRPSYGQAELEALTASNAHLAQVAIELAAFRRDRASGADAPQLDRLEADVRRHVETVSAAMAQGARRWHLKV